MKIVLALIAAFGFLGLIGYNVIKTVGDSSNSSSGADSMRSAAAAGGEQPPLPAPLSSKGKSPVLVELFTSEGCSSCPPADKNLILLEKQSNPDDDAAEVVTLALHVDYWNRLGWADPFSSAQFSERQSFYSRTFRLGDVYTPQMIVDGTHQFVGGNLDAAQKAIGEAVKIPKGTIELAVSGNNLKVKISGLPGHGFANVFLAIAENDLSTGVKSGENAGRTLPHTSVVRELRTIGSIRAEENSFETETAFELPASVRKENSKLVVFAQVEETSKIIGVSQIKP